jgi:hypothetical protein
MNDMPACSPLRRPIVRYFFLLIVGGMLVTGMVRCQQVKEQSRLEEHAWRSTWVVLTHLDMALKAYNEKFGRYPPRPNPEEIAQHIAKIFPKWQDWKADFRAAGLDITKMDDREALVFWLGGMTDQPGSRKLIGFNANPEHPLEPGPSRIATFFEFDEGRLVDTDGDGWWEYMIDVPPDWQRKAVHFDGKKPVLPGVEMPAGLLK